MGCWWTGAWGGSCDAWRCCQFPHAANVYMGNQTICRRWFIGCFYSTKPIWESHAMQPKSMRVTKHSLGDWCQHYQWPHHKFFQYFCVISSKFQKILFISVHTKIAFFLSKYFSNFSRTQILFIYEFLKYMLGSLHPIQIQMKILVFDWNSVNFSDFDYGWNIYKMEIQNQYYT